MEPRRGALQRGYTRLPLRLGLHARRREV